DIFYTCDVLLDDFARRRSRHIHRNIAAANHHHFFADSELVPKIHIQQEVDAFVDSVEIDSRNAEVAAAMRSNRDKHCVETLPATGVYFDWAFRFRTVALG